MINNVICDDEFEIFFYQDFPIYFETTILALNINHIIYCSTAHNIKLVSQSIVSCQVRVPQAGGL